MNITQKEILFQHRNAQNLLVQNSMKPEETFQNIFKFEWNEISVEKMTSGKNGVDLIFEKTLETVEHKATQKVPPLSLIEWSFEVDKVDDPKSKAEERIKKIDYIVISYFCCEGPYPKFSIMMPVKLISKELWCRTVDILLNDYKNNPLLRKRKTIKFRIKDLLLSGLKKNELIYIFDSKICSLEDFEKKYYDFRENLKKPKKTQGEQLLLL